MEDTTVVCPNNSVAIKKGSRAGTTEFAHKSRPLFVADRFSLENITRHMVKSINITGRKCFFIDNSSCFMMYLLYASLC